MPGSLHEHRTIHTLQPLYDNEHHATMTKHHWTDIAASIYAHALDLSTSAQQDLLSHLRHHEPHLHSLVAPALANDRDVLADLPQQMAVAAAEVLDLSGHTVDHYELGDVLGRGATSDVYQATDTDLRRPVAIKVFLPGLAAISAYVDTEILIGARLRHPNIVTPLARGDYLNRPYLVMEHAMPFEFPASTFQRACRAYHLLASIADALDVLHQDHHLVHRDVKPSNILRAQGAWHHFKLADFGLVAASPDTASPEPAPTGTFPSLDRLRIEHDRPSAARPRTIPVDPAIPALPLARDKTIAGTPGYIAPEVIDGHPALPQSDLYSLAVILWELLANRQLFQADSKEEILDSHLRVRIPPFPRLPAIEPITTALASLALSRHFEKALAKDPADRFQNAKDMKFTLGPDLKRLAFAARSRMPVIIRPRSDAWLYQE